MKKMRKCLPLIVVLISGLAWAGQDKSDKGESEISFKVLKDDNGKPVRNAAVIMHNVNEKGKASAGGMEYGTALPAPW